MEKFGAIGESSPIAKLALLGLDIASGPVAYAVRNFPPVAAISNAVQDQALDFFNDGFSSAGRSAEEAQAGAIGGIGVLGAAAGGFVGAAKKINGLTSTIKVADTSVIGNIPNGPLATLNAGESLRIKYAHLSPLERAERLSTLAEGNALRRLIALENSIPGAHFVEKHGAQTTSQAQLERAQTGRNPTTGVIERKLNGEPKIPSAATRFFSNRDQLNAIYRAQNIYNSTKDFDLAEQPFKFNSIIGEGYRRGALQYEQSTSAQVFFKNGLVNTAFPVYGK